MSSRGPDSKARRQAKDIVVATAPDLDTHSEYLERAKFLVAMDTPFPSIGNIDLGVRFELRRSIVFRRSYVVGWTRAKALSAIAPNCDAIAVPNSLPFGEPTPFVLAPNARRRDVSAYFSSVLEHEFVHVNQMLMCAVAPDYAVQSARTVVDAFFHHLRMEHDAYFVQGVRWPRVAPPPEPLSFRRWCLLRSHTPALERALEHVRNDTAMKALLLGVPQRAGERLRELGYGADDVAWFERRWPRDVVIAAKTVFRRNSGALLGRGALVAWLKRKDVAALLRTRGPIEPRQQRGTSSQSAPEASLPNRLSAEEFDGTRDG